MVPVTTCFAAGISSDKVVVVGVDIVVVVVVGEAVVFVTVGGTSHLADPTQYSVVSGTLQKK